MSVPSAPFLTAPAGGSYTDLAATGGPFSWIYSNTDGTTQSSYEFRRKLSGAGAYEYWNAGTAVFQSTVVDNVSTLQAVTFPAGAWTDGQTYGWSVATTSNAAQLGAFANDATAFAAVPPVTTVSGPTGAVGKQITVAWTVAVQAGMSQVQTAYRVLIEGGTYGATPGSGTVMYDSGVLSGSAVTYQVPIELPYSASYRVFVQTTVTGGQLSAWGSSSFTVAAPVNPLAPMVLAAVWDPTGQRTTLTVQGQDNLLSVDAASFETGTGPWGAQSNVAAITRTTAQALNGTGSLAVTATAAGAPVAVNSPTVTVTSGMTYTALVSSRAAATPQTVTVGIVWVNGSNTVLNTSTGAGVTDSTTGWTQATVTAGSPAGAASAHIVVTWGNAAAANEEHDLDAASIAPGSLTSWTRGGATGQVGAVVERTSNSGVTWTAIRASGTIIPAASQALTLYDLEPPLNVLVTYRIRQSPHPLLWDIDNWDDLDAVWAP